MKETILLGWSGGKDSALTLHKLKEEDYYSIILLTTVTEGYDRISMHGVRNELLDLQCRSIGCEVEKVFIPMQCTNEEYAQRMERAMWKYLDQNVTKMAFGDIHLMDVRKYRENNLVPIGMEPLFPIWGSDPWELAYSFIDLGFKAVTACVDLEMLEKKHAGNEYDKSFLESLPENADPCGEKGEFHTFVYDGPIFKQPVPVKKGEIVVRDNRFCYCDLLTAPSV